MIFYDWSGGMESSAMLVIDRERIRETGAIVRAVNTGKQFPEWMQSKAQIESILGLKIVIVPNRLTFDEYLLEKGGMVRKGTNDCSRRMKRGNLSRHMKTFERPPVSAEGLHFKLEADSKDYHVFLALNRSRSAHTRLVALKQGLGPHALRDGGSPANPFYPINRKPPL